MRPSGSFPSRALFARKKSVDEIIFVFPQSKRSRGDSGPSRRGLSNYRARRRRFARRANAERNGAASAASLVARQAPHARRGRAQHARIHGGALFFGDSKIVVCDARRAAVTRARRAAGFAQRRGARTSSAPSSKMMHGDCESQSNFSWRQATYFCRARAEFALTRAAIRCKSADSPEPRAQIKGRVAPSTRR